MKIYLRMSSAAVVIGTLSDSYFCLSIFQTPGRETDHGGIDVHRPEQGGSKKCC